MKKPVIFRLPIPINLKQKLFFRYYYPVKEKYFPLFENVEISALPKIILKLMPSDFMHGLITFTGCYERELSSRIKNHAHHGGLFVDVGANAGYFSLLWASCSSVNEVIAFEASPRNVAMIDHNIHLNDKQEQITLHKIALGYQSGVCLFDLGPEELTGWGGITHHKSERSIEVAVRRLDDLLDLETVIDVMKVDVEGADTWVIMGAEKLLRNKRIKVLYFEQNKPRQKELGISESAAEEFLSKLGYKVIALSNISDDIVEWMAKPK